MGFLGCGMPLLIFEAELDVMGMIENQVRRFLSVNV